MVGQDESDRKHARHCDVNPNGHVDVQFFVTSFHPKFFFGFKRRAAFGAARFGEVADVVAAGLAGEGRFFSVVFNGFHCGL